MAVMPMPDSSHNMTTRLSDHDYDRLQSHAMRVSAQTGKSISLNEMIRMLIRHADIGPVLSALPRRSSKRSKD